MGNEGSHSSRIPGRTKLHAIIRVSFYDKVLKRLLLGSALVLDAGCGFGEFSTVAAHAGKRVISADVSIERIRWCKSRVPSPVLCSVEWLPFRRNTFDAVFCSHLLEHFRDVKTLLHEYKTVLRDNGGLIVVVPFEKYHYNPYHLRNYEPSNLQSTLELAGFVRVRVSYDKLFYIGLDALPVPSFLESLIKAMAVSRTKWMSWNLLATTYSRGSQVTDN